MKKIWKILGGAALAAAVVPYRVEGDKDTGSLTVKGLLYQVTRTPDPENEGETKYQVNIGPAFARRKDDDEEHMYADGIVVAYRAEENAEDGAEKTAEATETAEGKETAEAAVDTMEAAAETAIEAGETAIKAAETAVETAEAAAEAVKKAAGKAAAEAGKPSEPADGTEESEGTGETTPDTKA